MGGFAGSVSRGHGKLRLMHVLGTLAQRHGCLGCARGRLGLHIARAQLEGGLGGGFGLQAVTIFGQRIGLALERFLIGDELPHLIGEALQRCRQVARQVLAGFGASQLLPYLLVRCLQRLQRFSRTLGGLVAI